MARTPLLNTIQKYFQTASVAEVSPSRRDFIAGAGVLILGATLPKAVWAGPKGRRIVIVGGGIAGLSCALKLSDHKVKATVYEASNRLGGRMFSNTGFWKDNQVSEWCGELIDTAHKTVQSLAKRFNLPLDNLLNAQPLGSEDTFYFDGQYYPLASFLLDIEPVILRVQEDLKAADYPTSYDQFTEAGKALDKLSVYEWIETRVSGGHASQLGQLLNTAYTIEYGADTKDQSSLNLIYLLAYQPQKGNVGVFGVSDEIFHIRGGNESLPRAIAQSLGPDWFQMGKRLVSLEKNKRNEYHLTFKNSQGVVEDVVADAVVLALPFSVLREIDTARAGFDALKNKAIQELGMGRSGKTQLQFNQRLWNKKGPWPGKSTGSTYSDTGYQCSWDVSRGQAGASGILNFFSGGTVTENMMTKQPFTSNGNPQAKIDAEAALQTSSTVYPGLADQWSGKLTQSIPHLNPLMKASYAFYRVGQYTTFGGYEKVSQGGVLFAGDHTSQDFQGFMEGGASEGERAANELLR